MTLNAIATLVAESKDGITLGVLVLVILMSFLEISKIKINPWSWLLAAIGKKLNKSMSDEITEIREKLDKHIKDDEIEKLETKRRDILDFANACMNGRRHTQEQFNFVIKKCDEYEKYIEENKIKNGEISSAIEEIRRLNTRCRQKNSFLKPGEEFEYSEE